MTESLLMRSFLRADMTELIVVVEGTPESNIVMFRTPGASALMEALRARELLLSDTGPNRIRAVTHIDVNSEAIDEALRRIADALRS